MNPLMNQLHDIEGLDQIGFWPLALGWWLLLFCVSVLAALLVFVAAKKIAFRRSWKQDALNKLVALERNLTDATARDTLIQLSEYIRRITLAQFPRKECAGLVGKEWLKWLASKDPRGFDWEKKGVLFIEAPYAPADRLHSAEHVLEFIQVIKHWVR